MTIDLALQLPELVQPIFFMVPQYGLHVISLRGWLQVGLGMRASGFVWTWLHMQRCSALYVTAQEPTIPCNTVQHTPSMSP